MDWKQFEGLARKTMSSHLEVELSKRIPWKMSKKFDMVSQDGRYVGDAKYLTLAKGRALPVSKFMEIAGCVWLLEKARAKQAFLVFGSSRGVPEQWLKKYGAMLKKVEFYFISATGKLERLV